MKRIIIIGGGVAGLGAAYKVRRSADAGHDVEFVLVEKDERLGGKLFTDVFTDAEGRRFVADGGSDSFLTDKTAVHRVARLLGIFDDEVGTMDENKRTFIVKDGRLVEMPDGIMMFAPTKIMPMATTKLYSWPAKFRMAFDLILPRKVRWAEGESAQHHDESLESFVVRRLGRESLDRLAEPLVGGVNGSDPKNMSLAATYPMLLDMEQKHGSLVKGFLAQRKKVEEMKKKHPPKPGAKRRTFFTSFHDGLQFFTDRLAEAAGHQHIRTGTGATAVIPTDDGWDVLLDSGERISGDAVIVATEGWAAAPLAAGASDRLAELVASIPCSSSATVIMAFAEEDCPFEKNWHGILSPMVEHRPLTGVSLMSSKWPDRAPEGTVLLRGFLGGPRDQAVLKKSDDELIEVARAQLVELLGVRPDATPVYAKLFRWDGGMPQYTLGHLDRVDEIETISASVAGFALAGGAYRGVGVPNCLESGERAVSKVLGDFGIELAEDQVEERRIY
ncbi:MAG TPA: protoporphyrinogen oxidase [Coriobacteriia bacterium]|nr:protoporphyrinogen oxidase [Coriobacteriia bacterium]